MKEKVYLESLNSFCDKAENKQDRTLDSSPSAANLGDCFALVTSARRAVAGVRVPGFTSLCISMSVTVYMKLFGTLADSQLRPLQTT